MSIFNKDTLKNPYFVVALVGMIAIPILRPCLRHVPDPPPVTREIPKFSLIDQNGEPFGTDELAGKVYIAHFFTDGCAVCAPRLEAMAALQDMFEASGRDVHLVSIAFDADAAALDELTAELGVDIDRWEILTGPREQIAALLLDGFGAGELGGAEASTEGTIDLHTPAHGLKLVIVDQQSRQRGGSYELDEEGVDELFHRAHHVYYEEMSD